MKRIIAALFLGLIFSFTQAQDLYDLYTLRTISITFYESKYDSVLRAWWHAGLEDRIPARLEMDGVTYDSVGIQYKGNATFMLAEFFKSQKFPLNIDMDFYKPGQTLLGYTKLKLGNNMTDPACVREALGSRIYQQYIPSPRTNFMKININGTYMGVFSNSESVNKQFLEKNYTTKSGTFYKCDPNPTDKSCIPWPFDPSSDPNLVWYGKDSCGYYDNYEIKSTYGWADLLNLIDVLNNNPSQIATVLNVDRALWHFAVSSVLNWDTYNGIYIHNYYLYKQKDGLFHVISSDFNESFKGQDSLNPVNTDSAYLAVRPLVDELIIKNPLYRKQYLAHLRTILSEAYDSVYLSPIIDSMQTLIAASVLSDPWYRFDQSDFYNNVHRSTFALQNFPFTNTPGILSTVKTRKQYLLNHPDVARVSPTISNTQRNYSQPVSNRIVWVTTTVFNSDKVELMVTDNRYGSFFIPITMFDDGAHQDGAPGDGTFGASIPYNTAGEKILYYVRAQNAFAMKLDPERAEYEFYSYVVGNAVGIAAQEYSAIKIIVYPNPSDGAIDVEFASGISGNYDVEISDLPGKTVFRVRPEVGADRMHLNLNHLYQGVYVLRYGSFSQRLVINK